VSKKKTFNKSAFLEAAETLEDRLVLNVVLADGESYTKEEVEKALNDWKTKEVEAE
jgi:hypothetical protein